jgi:hypothetical protein
MNNDLLLVIGLALYAVTVEHRLRTLSASRDRLEEYTAAVREMAGRHTFFALDHDATKVRMTSLERRYAEAVEAMSCGEGGGKGDVDATAESEA